MDVFDVIVVGAGPAGSTAAYRLAGQGARVALLDRARFPRDKPCGGGITVRGLQHLPIDVTPVVEDRIVTTQLAFADAEPIVHHSDTPMVLMTQRRRLDEHLAHAAADAGAQLREGTRVRSIECDEGGCVVRTDTGDLRAAVVVGADGCNGVSAKQLGLGARVSYGIAYEGNVTWDAVDPDMWRGRLLLEFGVVPGGYAWLFPKGDHANVGVGGWGGEGPRMRSHLAALCQRLGLPTASVAEARGYRLPLRHPATPVSVARGLVIGDAAGLVDPMSGDGMYEAFLSSRVAAQTVSDFLSGEVPDLTAYSRRLNGALSRHRAVSWVGKRLFDQFPRFARRVAASPTVWRRVEARVRGDHPHPLRSDGTGRAEIVARRIALVGHRDERGD